MYRRAVVRIEFDTDQGLIVFPEIVQTKPPDSIEGIGPLLGEAIGKLLAKEFFTTSGRQLSELSEMRDKLRERDERIKNLEAAVAGLKVDVPPAHELPRVNVPPPIGIPGAKETETNVKRQNQQRR